MYSFKPELDLVLKAKSIEEFLIAKDLLGVKRFNQHDSYDILATFAAQRRHVMGLELVKQHKHFTIGKWFLMHDLKERSSRQIYINVAMHRFCNATKAQLSAALISFSFGGHCATLLSGYLIDYLDTSSVNVNNADFFVRAFNQSLFIALNLFNTEFVLFM